MSRPLKRRPLKLNRITPKRGYCQCGKMPASSQMDAQAKHREMERKTGVFTKVRYYKCRFGYWHWTSMLDERDGTGRIRISAAESLM